jgi:hypothetical protein
MASKTRARRQSRQLPAGAADGLGGRAILRLIALRRLNERDWRQRTRTFAGCDEAAAAGQGIEVLVCFEQVSPWAAGLRAVPEDVGWTASVPAVRQRDAQPPPDPAGRLLFLFWQPLCPVTDPDVGAASDGHDLTVGHSLLAQDDHLAGFCLDLF